MSETLTITKEQLQEILNSVVQGAIRTTKELNPLEQKKYDEELKKEQRRARMMVQLGKVEEEAAERKRNGCSHSRWPATHGKMAGHAAPRGQGEWATSGQVHGYDIIGIICQRCGTDWLFRGTPQELDYANNAGLLGFAPPEEDRCVRSRCNWCSDVFTLAEFKAHDVKACKAKYDNELAKFDPTIAEVQPQRQVAIPTRR